MINRIPLISRHLEEGTGAYIRGAYNQMHFILLTRFQWTKPGVRRSLVEN